VQDADLGIAKIVNDPNPDEGDTVVFTLTLTNNGPDGTTNVVVTDSLPAGVTYVTHAASQGTGQWSVGSLANGASVTLTIDATVDSGTAGQIIINTASVTGADQADSVAANDSDSATLTVQSADLQVSKTVDNPVPNEGDTVTYTITLTNDGPDGGTNIVITDLLPSGVTYSSDTPSQGTYDSGSGAWSVGSMANGASATLDISATVDAGTAAQTITNTASVTAADQGDPTSANNSDSADIKVQGADLAVTKIVNDSFPNEGDTITYTVTLTNSGPDPATNVVITDSLPSGVTYSSDTPSQGTYVSGTGLWNVGTLNNGASATLTISVSVDAGTATQNITNTASVTAVDQADTVTANNSDSAGLTVQGADLEVTKIVSNSAPDEGDTITYTVTLANNGPDPATNVVITDLLPAGVTYSSDTPSQGTYVSGTGLWSVGTLNNGASATLTISASVDVGTATQTIVNTAELTGVDQADLDSTPNNNQPAEDDQDSASLTVRGADLAVTKIVDDSAPNEGDTITYTVTLTNNGPDTATNAVITDLLPGGVTYSSDTPSQGTYVSGTGLWTVGSLVNGASATLTITATVDAGTAGQTITNTASVTGVDQADSESGNNSDSAAWRSRR